MINLTDEEIYQRLMESDILNELFIDSDNVKDETYGDITLSMYIRVDKVRRIYSILMNNKIISPVNFIREHGEYIMYINRDTLESEFFIVPSMLATGDKESNMIERQYPKYWKETGFMDKFCQIEKILKRIASEMKDMPVVTKDAILCDIKKCFEKIKLMEEL